MIRAAARAALARRVGRRAGGAAFAALAAAVLLAGCGGDAAPAEPTPVRSVPAHVVPPRPLAAGPRLVESAPAWVRAFCGEVRRRSALACPRAVPSGFAAPELPQERPAARRFALSGSSGAEWRIEGRAGWRGPALAAARVRASGGGVVLRWRRYAIAVDGPGDPRLRRQVRAVARSMGRG